MINLLPYNEKKSIQRVRTVRTVVATLWTGIIVIGVLCLLLLPAMTIITTRYTLALGEIARLENAGAIVRPEAIEETLQRAKNAETQFVGGGTLPPYEALGIAQKNIPDGVVLSGFTLTADSTQKVVVQGVVTTRDTLQQYVEVLQKDPHVAMVDSPITNYLKQKDNEFTLTISFK